MQVLTLTAGSSQRAHVERACRKAGFEPKITAETMRLNLLRELVSQGTGIAVIPRSSAGPGDRTALIPITWPSLRVRIVLASGEATPSPAARAFMRIVATLIQAGKLTRPD